MLSVRRISIAIALVMGLPLASKVTVDFDPNVAFSKYETFAYIGVENLVMMQLNPDLISNRFHRLVVRELTKKGFREVQPGQNPDLVVRYWSNSTQQSIWPRWAIGDPMARMSALIGVGSIPRHRPAARARVP
jgi:hypothetical protein